jgi:FG-GAP repeat
LIPVAFLHLENKGAGMRFLTGKVRSTAVAARVADLSPAALGAALACALILGAGTQPAAALSLTEDPFAQQGEGPFLSAEVTELAEQGYSVALSANGDTAIVGSPDYKEGHAGEVFRGAAWIYVRSGSTWTQQAKLVGHESSGDAQQGHSVALSANGDTAIVGGPEDTGGHEEYFGAVWVFVREGTTWHEQQKLVATTGASEKAAQGSSVALSSDGNTALVGAMNNEYNKTTTRAPGAAFVFTRSGLTWSQQGGKLEGKHSGELVQEGTSVALSSDGKTALIGGPRAEGEKGEREAGAAWTFLWNGSEWKEQAKLPQATGTGLETGQGQSVALSGDGNTALVGGPGYKNSIGGAWVYVRSGESWEQQGAPLQGNDASTLEADEEGSGVALSEDGNTALVGGYRDSTSTGAAWAFERSGSSWSEQEKLQGSGGTAFAEQGFGVALSADSTTALVGAPGNKGEVGAAWVFTRAGEPSGQKEPQKESKEQLNPNNPSTATGQNVSTGAGAPLTGSSPSGRPSEPSAHSAAQLEAALATAFGLPAATACYSRRSFEIHIHQPHGYPKIVSAEVFLGGHRERSLSKKGLAEEVVLTKLPYGTFTIRIVARTATGTALTGTRTYHTCRSKPLKGHRHKL